MQEQSANPINELVEAIKSTMQQQHNTLTAYEAAEYLKISYWQLTMEVKAGRIPHFRIGRRIFCHRDVLEKHFKTMELASIQQESNNRIRRVK